MNGRRRHYRRWLVVIIGKRAELQREQVNFAFIVFFFRCELWIYIYIYMVSAWYIHFASWLYFSNFIFAFSIFLINNFIFFNRKLLILVNSRNYSGGVEREADRLGDWYWHSWEEKRERLSSREYCEGEMLVCSKLQLRLFTFDRQCRSDVRERSRTQLVESFSFLLNALTFWPFFIYTP